MSMTRSPSSIRLVLVATVLAAAIFSTTALWLTMQRDAEIEGYRSAVMALGNGMGRQTTRWISSIDKALVETRADMAAAQAAVPDPRARRFTAALRGKPITDALARRRQSLTDVADVLLPGMCRRNRRMCPTAKFIAIFVMSMTRGFTSAAPRRTP
jgi:hypothetical protein